MKKKVLLFFLISFKSFSVPLGGIDLGFLHEKQVLLTCFYPQSLGHKILKKSKLIDLFIGTDEKRSSSLFDLSKKQKKVIERAVKDSFKLEREGIEFSGFKTCEKDKMKSKSYDVVIVGFDRKEPFLKSGFIGNLKKVRKNAVNSIRINRGFFEFLESDLDAASGRAQEIFPMFSGEIKKMGENWKEFFFKRGIVHEFAHILGLRHEFMREDLIVSFTNLYSLYLDQNNFEMDLDALKRFFGKQSFQEDPLVDPYIETLVNIVSRNFYSLVDITYSPYSIESTMNYLWVGRMYEKLFNIISFCKFSSKEESARYPVLCKREVYEKLIKSEENSSLLSASDSNLLAHAYKGGEIFSEEEVEKENEKLVKWFSEAREFFKSSDFTFD